jgi:protein-S-isoprenylcysteine O-methyltransferase Ste14
MKTNLATLLNLATLAIVVFVLVILVLYPPPIAWDAAKAIGAVIAGVSLPLFMVARFQLGDSFSVMPKARRLVTTGLYSRFRNPIYLFSGLLLAGLSLFATAWGPLVVAAVLIPVQFYRAHREEQVLMRAFGEEYRRYREKT